MRLDHSWCIIEHLVSLDFLLPDAGGSDVLTASELKGVRWANHWAGTVPQFVSVPSVAIVWLSFYVRHNHVSSERLLRSFTFHRTSLAALGVVLQVRDYVIIDSTQR